MLKLLAPQPAISLENTRLYRDLEEREAKIRHLVDANIMGIFIWNLEGEIIEANETFLHMLEYSREDFISGCVRWKSPVKVFHDQIMEKITRGHWLSVCKRPDKLRILGQTA